jgi:hypothetical protein
MPHDRLIDRLFVKEERPLVRAIVDRCLHGLHEDRQIAVLHEIARPANESMSDEQTLNYVCDFITAIGGQQIDADRFSSFVMSGGHGWTDPYPIVDEPGTTSPYDGLIQSLWPNRADQAAAREFVAHFHRDGLEDRIIAVIRESAMTDRAVEAKTMTVEAARQHLLQVASLGVPADVAEGMKTWFATLPPADAPPAMPEPSAEPAPAPPAGPTRDELHERIARHGRGSSNLV